MGKTSIEWCDTVWNPTTGCTKVGAGCKNCYAERMASRFWGERKFTDVRCHRERLDAPLHWRKPRRVFVDSMSDLFHKDVPFEFVAKVFGTMALCFENIFMILTKRPERMRDFSCNYLPNLALWSKINEKSLRNVWLGVSAERQEEFNERTYFLDLVPATIRFASIEPMLGEIRLGRARLDWIICGCESGPGARPMFHDWARSLRDQCQEAGVPFFLKQMMIDGKLVKMPALDGVVWNQFPKTGDGA